MTFDLSITHHEREPDLDLGFDHWLWFHQWSPDRSLNPHLAHLPDVPKFGASVGHLRPDGSYCEGAITFDGLGSPRTLWQVQSWEPLTISPSLLCKARIWRDGSWAPGEHCGDHGFIRNGAWVVA